MLSTHIGIHTYMHARTNILTHFIDFDFCFNTIQIIVNQILCSVSTKMEPCSHKVEMFLL